MVIEWLEFVFDTVVVVASVLALFEGAKRIAVNGVTRSAIATLTFGAVMCSAWVSMNYFKFQSVTKILVQLEESGDFIVPPREQWSTSLSREQREEIGVAMARHEYFRHGKLTSYVDRSGSPKLFSPSQREVTEREDNLKQLTHLKLLANARFQDAISLSLWALLSAMFGYFLGQSSKRDS